MVSELKQPQKAAHLFEGWQETMIWSCLQGVMGNIYADASEHPSGAMALLGDFCFLAGKPDRDLVMYQPEGRRLEYLIMVPQKGTDWDRLIESCYGHKAVKVTRYAFKNEPDVFDKNRLRSLAAGLPQGYTIRWIDEPLFRYCADTHWCRDWTSCYEDYAQYCKYGLGVVILKDSEPVSGASSYTSYHNGIEIQTDTRADYRRKGLATICAATLILECLKRGWYPGWDAQNPWSASLAEKLGYHRDGAYTAYEVNRK